MATVTRRRPRPAQLAQPPPPPANGAGPYHPDDVPPLEHVPPLPGMAAPGGRPPPLDLDAGTGFGASSRDWQEDVKLDEILANEENFGAKVEVYRRTASGTQAFLDTYPLEDWNADKKKELAAMYGGGHYKCKVRRQSGTWGPSWSFVIDAAIRPKPEAQAEAAQRQEAREAMNPFAMFTLMLQQQQQAQGILVQQMMKSQETMVSVLTAVLSRPPPPGPSDALLAPLVQRALAPAATAPAFTLEGVISAVAKLRNIANADGPVTDKGDRDGDFLDKILGALPSVMKFLGQVQLPPPPASTPQTSLPAPAPAAPQPAPAPAETVTELEPEASLTDTGAPPPPDASRAIAAQNRAALAVFLPQIIAQADGGQSAATVAGLIDEALEDEQFDALLDLLERPDWLAVLADVHDGVLLRSPFFTQLRDELLARDAEETGPEDENSAGGE